jgi:hypothetical protein
MPKKVLPSEEDFERFSKYMIERGFRVIGRPEFINSFRRLSLSNPRRMTGRETGFSFSANGLTAFVWTTFLEFEGTARENDSGWVLISEGDEVQYYSHPLMRTAGFLDKLLKYAIIAKRRIQYRPLCPACNGFMKIAQGKGLKSRYWRCPKHRRFEDFDHGLTDKMKEFLKSERRSRRKYRNKLKKEGRTVIPAILARRPWKAGNPQNRI